MKVRGKKNTSKRKSLKVQHKITKKATEKKRKLRKEARKALQAGVQIKRRKEKMTVPSLWPFKNEELADMKARQERREAEQAKQKELNARKRKELLNKKKKKAAAAPTRPVNSIEQTLHHADLIVQVIDARDPFATRCMAVENLAGKGNKVTILTKGDLVPKENLQQWLDYLRSNGSNVVLSMMKRASNEEAGKLIRPGSDGGKKSEGKAELQSEGQVFQAKRTTRFVRPVGFRQLSTLMSQSFNACRNVAVVGYPGVGKHTVMGYLKSPQMNLNKKVKLTCASIIDENEIEPAAGEEATSSTSISSESAAYDLLFGKKPQAAKRPLFALKRLLERLVTKKDLVLKLALPQFEDVTELLKKIEKENNLQGGPLDAARFILKKFNGFSFFSQVPGSPVASTTSSTEQEGQRETSSSKKNKSTLFSPQQLATLYSEQKAEIEAISSWGKTTPISGLLSIEAAATASIANLSAGSISGSVDLKSVLHAKGRSLGQETEYFPLKCPVAEDGVSIVCGGPEPFGLAEEDDDCDMAGKGHPAVEGEDSSEDDEDMEVDMDDEEEEEEEEEEEMSDDEEL
ncbi:unnamed protein product [Amoebophrya sp. A25]|nr:unnamed protein product [Amoebophrya sp. A25]|eukprot:GSA25T00014559001.1